MTKDIVRYAILLNLFVTLFLFSERSEQSPFELIKLLSYGAFAIFGILIWLTTHFNNEEVNFKWNPVLLVQLGILATTTLSLVFSNSRFNSFWGNYNIPSDGVFSLLVCVTYSFLLIQYFSESEWLLKIKYVLTASGVVLALYGIIQHFGYDPISWWGYPQMHLNAYGTIGQAVGYATVIACLLPLVSVFFYTTEKNIFKSLFAIALFVMMLGMMYSGSRTPVILGLFSILGISALQLIKPLSLKKIKSVSAVLILMGVVLTAYYFDPNNSLARKFKTEAVSTGVNERMQVWRGAYDIWQKYPLLGAGPETFALELKLVNTKDFNTNQNWGLYWHKAHNHLMHYLATIGVLGLFSHLLLLIYVLYRFYLILKLPLWTSTEYFRIAFIFGYGLIFVGNLTAFNFITSQLYSLIFPLFENLLSQNSKPFKLKSPLWMNRINLALLYILIFSLSSEMIRFAIGDWYFTYSRRELELNRNMQGALYSIDRAIKVHPNDCRLYFRKASLLTTVFKFQANAKQSLNFDEAVRVIDDTTMQGLDCEPNNPESWLYRSKLFEELYAVGVLNDLQLIQRSVLEGAKYAPINPLYPYHLGLNFFRQGQSGNFLEQMYKAVDLKADFVPAYMQLIEYFYLNQNQNEVNRLITELSKAHFYSGEFLNDLKKLMQICLKYNDHANVVTLGKVYEKFALAYLNKF